LQDNKSSNIIQIINLITATWSVEWDKTPEALKPSDQTPELANEKKGVTSESRGREKEESGSGSRGREGAKDKGVTSA